MNSSLLFSSQLRDLEAAHADDLPPLMHLAGQAAAVEAMRILAGQTAPVLVIAGPGNNGGDAFALAQVLYQHNVSVVVVFLGDELKLPADAQGALAAWRKTLLARRIASADFSGNTCFDTYISKAYLRAVPEALNYSLVVDGLFGIGLTRSLTGEYAAIVERINQFAGPVLALDIPSGLDADTGRVIGAGTAPGCAVRATHTISFIAAKPGLYTLDGPDHCGQIRIADLGLTEAVDALRPAGQLLARKDFQSCLKPRQRNTHKGRFGSLGVIGGAPGMVGAALLAGRAALHLGAGRVFVGVQELLPVDVMQPELMLRTVEDTIAQATAVVIGPGLGTSDMALDNVRQVVGFLHSRRVVSADFSLLLDADALNLLALHPVLAASIARRTAPTVMTPHPAEAARLLAITIEAIQADRVASAREIARRFNAHVALKGCGTVIAHPDGRWYINPTGNPGLASGGTGDVLSGVIGALLAQSWPAAAALMCGVYLHGAAADALVNAGHGPVGLTASELISASRRLLNEWIIDNATYPV